MSQEKIGSFIAENRKIKNLTQAELGMRLGVSDKTVSKWECGYSAPDITLLISLCKELDITVNELLEGRKNKSIEKDISQESKILNQILEKLKDLEKR